MAQIAVDGILLTRELGLENERIERKRIGNKRIHAVLVG